MEEWPLQPQSTPLHVKCSLVGHKKGLYLYWDLKGHASRALIDTGSTHNVRPGTLSGMEGSMPTEWSATTMQMRMVTVERVAFKGGGYLQVMAGTSVFIHEFR